MRTIVALLVTVGTLFLGSAPAAADAEDYMVSRSWKLTYSHGYPRIVPHVEDDVVESTCHNDDQMTDWRVNDEDLVDEWWVKADGTGVQVRPEFTGETEILEITIRCEKA